MSDEAVATILAAFIGATFILLAESGLISKIIHRGPKRKGTSKSTILPTTSVRRNFFLLTGAIGFCIGITTASGSVGVDIAILYD